MRWKLRGNKWIASVRPTAAAEGSRRVYDVRTNLKVLLQRLFDCREGPALGADQHPEQVLARGGDKYSKGRGPCLFTWFSRLAIGCLRGGHHGATRKPAIFRYLMPVPQRDPEYTFEGKEVGYPGRWLEERNGSVRLRRERGRRAAGSRAGG